MKRIFIVAIAIWTAHLQAQERTALKLTATIPMTRVEGRIDHLSVDLKGQRLFVAALGNKTLEVLDLSAGKRIRSIIGLSEPQGVRFVPELDEIFVASAGDGTIRSFNAKSFAETFRLTLGSDADNVRYNSATGQIIVGYGDGALAILNAKTHALVGTVKLSGHPESFQLERSRARMYVNVPTANHVAVVDMNKQAVIATWPMGQYRSNFPMALDEANHRLLIGTRRPANLVVFDTESGKQVAVTPCSGDTDDLFYDADAKRVYVSAGEGFIDVFKQDDADHYQRIARTASAAGARTSLFVPELGRLFLAVPHREGQESSIRVYDVGLSSR